MADKATLEIRFENGSGLPVAMDRVVLIVGGMTTERNAPPYKFDLNGPGVADITFYRMDYYRYHFKLNITDVGGDISVSFHKDMVDKPKMGRIVRLGPDSVMTFTLRDKPSEVVLVSGYDYEGGMHFRIFTNTRMSDLWKAGAIDDNTVITFFEMQTGHRTQWVKGEGAETARDYAWTSGWCRMDDELQGTAPPALRTGDSDCIGRPGNDTISITHVYRYIEGVGETRAVSIKELSIFGHSWVGGPIMFNTCEREAFRRNNPARDPEDHDARYWKDFNDTNMPNRSSFLFAFTTDAFIKVWGCQAATQYFNLTRTVCGARDDTTPLGIQEDDRTDNFRMGTGRVYDDNRPGIVNFLKEAVYKANYMYRLSEATGLPVWGSPPGFGSLYRISGFYGRQFVQGNAQIDCLKRLIPGWEFSQDNYLKYKV